MASIFKNNKVYKYFEWHFKFIDNKNENLKNSIEEIQNSIANIEKYEQNLQQKLDTIYNLLENQNTQNMYQRLDTIYSLIENQSKQNNIMLERTKQFDCINTELLKLKPINKCKILLVGFYGAPNTGDELMLQALLNKLNFENNSITVMLADNPNYNLLKKYNVNYIHYPKTNMDINMISEYFDKIIFGGGAMIDDFEYDNTLAYKYSTPNILMNLSIKAIYNKKEIYCIGLSSNSYISNPRYIQDLEFVIANSKHFSLRDENSKKTLISSNIHNAENILVINDIVYSLPRIQFHPRTDSFTLGLVLIGFAEEEKLINILRACDTFIKQNSNLKNCKIILIPFYDYCNSDILEYNKIVNSSNISTTIEILKYEQEYEKLMEQFNLCNILVCMRYHSSLLALKSGIPSVHIVYDVHRHYKNKMNFLREQFGYNETYLSFKEITQNDIINSLNFVLNNYEEMHENYKQISSKIENNAINNLTEILP